MNTYDYRWVMRGAELMSERRPDIFPSAGAAEIQLVKWMYTLRTNPGVAYVSSAGFMLGISTDDEGETCYELTQHLVDWYDSEAMEEEDVTGFDWIKPLGS